MSVRATFFVLRRLFSLPPGYAESGKSLEELKPVYRRWELFSLPLLFGLVPPFLAAWWWILYHIGVWNAQRFSGAVYHLWPPGIAWCIPAFLLAVTTASVPMTLFYRWCLRERYPEFMRYLNLQHRYNHDSATVPLCAFFLVIVLVAVVLILHNRVLLTNDEIIQYPFFSLSSTRHKYTDITDIRTAPKRRAPNGNLRDNNDFATEFTDGSMWFTLWIPADLTAAEKRQMMEFVSRKSGKPIRVVPVLESGW